jgi:tryptophan-rich sensory protein
MATISGTRGPIREGVELMLIVVLCLGVGAIGGVTTASSVDTWYAEIAKPAWTPPSPVFAPVWTIFFVLMGVAAWMVWRAPVRAGLRAAALICFAAQLGLNALWSQLFFGMQNPGAALVDIVVLWIAIVATIFLFRRVELAAGWLLVPYLAWVTFAAALNAAIWSLN